MPDSAIKQIMDETGARLALIKTVNGYSFTAKKIDRARRKPWRPGDLPAINYWNDEDKFESAGHGHEKRSLSVFVEVHTATMDEPFTDIAAALAADICTSLYRKSDAPSTSDAASPALGGLVTRVIVDSILPAIGEGQTPYCGVLIELTIKYNLEINNTFTIVN